MPDAFMESDQDVGGPDAEIKQEANEEAKEVQSVGSGATGSSEETITSVPTDGSADTVNADAHLWSEGGHD